MTTRYRSPSQSAAPSSIASAPIPLKASGGAGISFRNTSSIRARIARPPAPCLRVTRSSRIVSDLHRASPRLGMPPYWCQILQVPSLETMQAPTGVSGTHSRPKSVQSFGDAIPDMMSPQMQLAASVGGA